MKNKSIQAFLIAMSLTQALNAETTARFFRTSPTGRYVFQFANPIERLGSKLSYTRNAPQYGIELETEIYRFIIGGRYQRTPTGANKQDFRDEDFFMSSFYSGRADPQIDYGKGIFGDQIDMYYGVRNWADGYGSASFKEYQGRLWLLFALTNNWAIGVQSSYAHNFYNVKDTTTFFYGLSGAEYTLNGLTFESDFIEWQAGFRYNTDSKPIRFQADFFLGEGIIRTRDLHIVRSLMLKSVSDGPSLFGRLGLSWHDENVEIGAGLYARRLFTRGNNNEQTSPPGLTIDIGVLAPVDVSYKENGMELSVGWRIP